MHAEVSALSFGIVVSDFVGVCCQSSGKFVHIRGRSNTCYFRCNEDDFMLKVYKKMFYVVALLVNRVTYSRFFLSNQKGHLEASCDF